MGVTRCTRKKNELFVPGILAITTYLWCCNSLGNASDNEPCRDNLFGPRPHSLQTFKIESLELRIDAVLNEFKLSSKHCAELGSEILGVAEELRDLLTSRGMTTERFAHLEGDDYLEQLNCFDNKYNDGIRRKGFMPWMFMKLEPVLQVIGLISTIYVFILMFKEFKKSQVPKISEKWRIFKQKVTFDPSFDYMVDVYQFNRECNENTFA